jgi:hypothetical protein|tara:strand:+ start:2004 stop:2726 length:723 start_codon:yes stop_codon:yes gene_type:complete
MNLKENIKKQLRLVNEQSTPQWHYWRYLGGGCGPSGCDNMTQNDPMMLGISGNRSWQATHNFYTNVMGSPNVGEVLRTPHATAYQNCGGFFCLEYLGYDTTDPGYGAGAWQNLNTPTSTFNSGTPLERCCDCRDGFHPYGNSPGGCIQPPSTGCDTNGPFGPNFNLQNWINDWTTSGPFNNQTNANQPCNHICGQITTWTNNLTTASPVHANQLECKIEEGMAQYATHGCAQVNSNNCPI